MVRSLFVWSKDLWNGERGQNGDLSTAKYVFADKADEKEKKEWPFCSLYYEEGTADDNGGTPVAFAEKSMPWQGGTLKLRTVRCSYPNGSTKDFVFPDPKSVSQDYDLRQAGENGQVNYTPLGKKDGVRQGGVSFHVDEIMSMDASADKNREKVKEFLAKQIDAKISGAMNAESMGAESFNAETVWCDNCAEELGEEDAQFGDVHVVTSMPVDFDSGVAGESATLCGDCHKELLGMGAESSYGETFESEFSVERVNPTVVKGSADVYGAETFSADSSMMDDVMIDESSMDTVYPEGDGRIMGQSIASSDLTPLGSRAENGETEMVAFEESPMDLVMPEGEGNVIGQSTPTTDFTPFGARAEEGFSNEGFAMEGFFPDGDGRTFGDITAKANFTPISRAEESPRRAKNKGQRMNNANRGSSRFGMGGMNGGFSLPTSDSPFARASEDFNAYDDPITDRQKYKIGKLGGRMKRGMNRSKASDYIKELQGRESGTWRAESPMADDVMIDESSMDTVYPEGDGRIMGQSIANTDFTPLGSRADTMKSGFFKGVAGAFLVGLVANMAMAKKGKTDVPETDNENGE